MREGNRDGALVYAKAAVEVAPQTAGLAAALADTIELDELLSDPRKASAMRELQDIDVVMAAFERDVQATYSQSLQDSAWLI